MDWEKLKLNMWSALGGAILTAIKGGSMGDKGKKDKDKIRKQKMVKQQQTAQKNLEKQPGKTLDGKIPG
jgi:hypothetical protein